MSRYFCQVAYCDNTRKNSPSMVFFRFPNPDDKVKWEKWTANIELKKPLRNYMFICGNHFEMKAFTDTFRKRLIRYAVPTIQIPIQNENMSVEVYTTPIKEEIVAEMEITNPLHDIVVKVADETERNSIPLTEKTDNEQNIYLPIASGENQKTNIPNSGAHFHKLSSTVTEKTDNEQNISLPIAPGENQKANVLNSGAHFHKLSSTVTEKTVNEQNISLPIAPGENQKANVLNSGAHFHKLSSTVTEKADNEQNISLSIASSENQQTNVRNSESHFYRLTEKAMRINRYKELLHRVKKKLLFRNPVVSTTASKTLLLNHLKRSLKPPLLNIISSQIRNSNKPINRRIWTAEDKKFSLDIYLSNPSTYQVLKKYLCLPSLKSMQTIYNKYTELYLKSSASCHSKPQPPCVLLDSKYNGIVKRLPLQCSQNHQLRR